MRWRRVAVVGGLSVALAGLGAVATASGALLATAPTGVIVFDQCQIHGQGITGLCSIRPNGQGLRQLTQTGETNPSLSHDGKSLAFDCGTYSKFDSGICVKTAGKLEQLSKTGADPSWAPSGKQIVFDSCQAGGTDGGLCVINLATRKVRRLTGNSHDELPQWSPTGSQILFVIAIPFDNTQGVYVMNVNNPHPRHLVDIVAFDASWSPGATAIAYDHGYDGAWIMTSSGAENHQLVASSPNEFTHPSWSPSGKTIVGTVNQRLSVVPAAGGTPRQISGVNAGDPYWGR